MGYFEDVDDRQPLSNEKGEADSEDCAAGFAVDVAWAFAGSNTGAKAGSAASLAAGLADCSCSICSNSAKGLLSPATGGAAVAAGLFVVKGAADGAGSD